MKPLISSVVANAEPGGPLWLRAPTKDEEGRPLSDFMMLVKGFNRWPQARQEQVFQLISTELARFADSVVFADLNTKINLLWISHRPGKGFALTLANALHAKVPEAVLIANKAEMMMGAGAGSTAQGQQRGIYPAPESSLFSRSTERSQQHEIHRLRGRQITDSRIGATL